MTDRDRFKLAFLNAMAEQGLTLEEVHGQVKTAIAVMEKPAGFWDTLGTTGAIGLLATPPLLGAAVGTAAAHMTPSTDETPDTVKTQELIERYRQLTQQARVNRALKARKLGERPSFSRL